MKKSYFPVLVIFLVLSASACTPESPPSRTIVLTTQPETQVPTDLPIASATTTNQTSTPKTSPVTLTPTPQFSHRIGIRLVSGEAEFYDRLTGDKFVPRGYNYVRLAPMSQTNPGLWHSTLNPGYYDRERAGAALQAMHAEGYNVVRIFVDCCREGNNVGDPAGGISTAYLENVIDFLEKAKANEIYVLLISDLTPAQGGYDDMWQHCCETFAGENLRYLTPGGHRGERRFNQDLIRALIDAGAPLEAIFAYDLTNEVHFNLDKPPFSLTAGKVTTANNKTYDMAVAEDKRRMMDENLVYWIDQQRAAILEVDPSALVTVSFPAINSGQTTVDPRPAIWESTADFVDLHTYLGWGLSLDQYMERFGVDQTPEKPIILGEFGASNRAYPTADSAGQALKEWQVASCKYGFDGWLLWTWDGFEQAELWNGISENGEISSILSPLNRPDPCK
ncbi:MAG: cellulase family glycosylhydrolase [Chloroflexota bacterium]|nr:MAG: cellulase family glycosylhydrolase [Chloroflexota bacterium]